jgi:uncharacterized protein YcbK (DUF882 family)
MDAQDQSLDDLQTALLAAGVVNFTIQEITFLPKAKPPRCFVPDDAQLVKNLIRVSILAQAIRTELGAPLSVSSGYRPAWYNTAVGGAPSSAHTRAAALDLNARNSDEALKLRSIAESLWRARAHNFAGLGLYRKAPRRIHIDVLHPGGKDARRWWY